MRTHESKKNKKIRKEMRTNKNNRRIGEMDVIMCLANFSSLKTMHDLGKLISFTLF